MKLIAFYETALDDLTGHPKHTCICDDEVVWLRINQYRAEHDMFSWSIESI